MDQPKVQRKGHSFSVDPSVKGKCSGPSQSALVVSLGKLDSGEYSVNFNGHTVAFVVEPAGTDPGVLEEELRLKIAVIQARGAPGRNFGIAPDELRKLLGAALDVGLQPDGKDRWTYSFTDGQYCTITQLEGQVTRGPGGLLTVSPATVKHTEHVPC